MNQRARVLALALCGMTLAVAVAFVVVAIIDPNAGGPEGNVGTSGPSPHDTAAGGFVPYAVFSGIVFAAFAVVGCIVAARRPRNPIGWFLAVGGLLWSLGVLSSTLYWHLAFGRSDPPAAAEYLAAYLEPNFPPDPRAASEPGFDPAIKPPIDGAFVWLRRSRPDLVTVFADLGYQRSSRTDVGAKKWFDRVIGVRNLAGLARRIARRLRGHARASSSAA